MLKENGHNSEDEEYFRSYSDMAIHLDMINDKVRTKTYRQAILKNYDIFFKKVVLDVGAGTGILSMFCVQAGASKVYAVEASDMALEIEKVVKDNGMEDRIKVIRGRVEDIEIEEKVDVIISEWMGHFLFYESMLQSVLYARDRFLKKDGFMFPSRATISLAAVSDDDVLMDGSDVWESVNSSYHLDMSSLKDKSLRCFTEKVHVLPADPTSIVSFPFKILDLDLRMIPMQSLFENFCRSSFSLKSFGSARINGLCAFFDVFFRGNIVLSTSPYKQLTHWSQSVMYLKNHFDVEQDDPINGTIAIKSAPNSKRGLSVHVVFESPASESGEDNADVRRSQTFLLDRFV